MQWQLNYLYIFFQLLFYWYSLTRLGQQYKYFTLLTVSMKAVLWYRTVYIESVYFVYVRITSSCMLLFLLLLAAKCLILFNWKNQSTRTKVNRNTIPGIIFTNKHLRVIFQSKVIVYYLSAALPCTIPSSQSIEATSYLSLFLSKANPFDASFFSSHSCSARKLDWFSQKNERVWRFFSLSLILNPQICRLFPQNKDIGRQTELLEDG